MPKGYKHRIIFDESDYASMVGCGFYVQGRPAVQKLKIRLHIKNCPICSKCSVSKSDINKICSKSEFEKDRPAPIARGGGYLMNGGLRACDRHNNNMEENWRKTSPTSK